MDDLRTIVACETGESTEVDRIIELVMKAIQGDVRRFAETLVTKRDDELLVLCQSSNDRLGWQLYCHP